MNTWLLARILSTQNIYGMPLFHLIACLANANNILSWKYVSYFVLIASVKCAWYRKIFQMMFFKRAIAFCKHAIIWNLASTILYIGRCATLFG